MNGQRFVRSSMLIVAILSTGCSAILHYQAPVSGPAEAGTRSTKRILLADMGSLQSKADDHLGWSQSYWLPIHWSAKDRSRQPLILHRWITESFATDLRARGYSIEVAPQTGQFSTSEEAFKAGRELNADRIVTMKLRRLGSFTGGYLVIPLVNIMSARLEVDFVIFDRGGKKLCEKTIAERHVSAKGWKVLILDSPIDALWGKRWFQKEYPGHLLPEVFQQITAELESPSCAGE